MADQLVFNDSLNLLDTSIGTGITTLGGTVNVDYSTPTPTVSGQLNLDALGTLGAQAYTNLAVTQTGTATDGTPIYTLTGSNTLTNISITYTGQLPTAADSSVNLLSTNVALASGSGNVTSTVVCFVSGTRLRTADGYAAVEDLREGDVVVTATGEHRSIQWIGHRTIRCIDHPRPQDVLPVCISAHAFGAGRPSRDLYVSPGHAICVDVLGDVLIPASALINGATVTQVDVSEVSYWHVDLGTHDILLAEDLPVESYIDVGNRSFFANSNVVSIEPFAERPAVCSTENYCRPFHIQSLVVGAVRAQMRERALELGWSLSNDFDFHLEVDGTRIDPVIRGLVARFFVPKRRDAWLVTAASRPRETCCSDDGRLLGLCVTSLRIEDGFGAKDIALTDERLTTGLHEVEDGARRWTAERVLLPQSLWEDCPDGCFLRIELAGGAVPRWQKRAGTCVPLVQVA